MTIALQISNPAILAGAGISVDAPASLPSGELFLEGLLYQLAPSHKMAQDLLLHAGRFVRLDALMKRLVDEIDPGLCVLDYFDARTSANDLHRGLARLLAQSQPVLTTNFDWGIEAACREAHAPFASIYNAAGCQDFLRGRLIPAPLLLKLHGSLRDAEGNDIRSAVCEILPRVDRNNGVFGLHPEFRQACEQILRQHDLVVAGYSGANDFDVSEMLAATESTRQLLWIRHVHYHAASGGVQILGWSDIEKNFNDALSGQSALPRDVQLLYELGHFNRRPKDRLWLIIAPTRLALSGLFPDSFHAAIPPPSRVTQNQFRYYLKQWAKTVGVTRPQRWHFCGGLFQETADHIHAIYAYHIGHIWTKDAQRADLAPMFDRELLALYIKTNDLQGAAECAERLKQTPSGESAKEQAQHGLALARFYEVLNQPLHAARYYHQAFLAGRRSGDHGVLGNIAESIGERYHLAGRIRPAERWLLRALEHNRQAPNMRKVADLLCRVAYLYALAGATERAVPALVEAERLYLLLHDHPNEIDVHVAQIESAEFGDQATQIEAHIKRAEYLVAITHSPQSRGMLRKAIAGWHLRRKEYAQAQRYLDEAKADLTAVSAQRNQLQLLVLCGCLALEQNDFLNAEDMLYQALLTSQELGDSSMRAQILFKQAELALCQAEIEIAHSWVEQALKTVRSLGWPRLEIDCLRLRAEIHFHMKNHKAMAEDLSAAVTLAGRQPSPVPLAHAHRSAAILLAMTNDWLRAGEHAETAIKLLEQAHRANDALATALRTAPILCKRWGKAQFGGFLDRIKDSGEDLDEQTLGMMENLLTT
ncbi:MAG: SIR2 family protein [bacterium]